MLLVFLGSVAMFDDHRVFYSLKLQLCQETDLWTELLILYLNIYATFIHNHFHTNIYIYIYIYISPFYTFSSVYHRFSIATLLYNFSFVAHTHTHTHIYIYIWQSDSVIVTAKSNEWATYLCYDWWLQAAQQEVFFSHEVVGTRCFRDNKWISW